MRTTLLLIAVGAISMTGTAFGVSYTSDFEANAVGSLPAPWTVSTPWGTWAPGPLTASVQPSPTGGQALKLVWDTDWTSNQGSSSGEADCTLDMTGLDLSTAKLHYNYDFYKVNWRVWQVAGDQTWFPPGGIHMNDDPAKPNKMVIGTDDSTSTTNALTDVPEGTWVHVVTDFDAATDAWTTTVSYPTGSGGGTFNGTSINNVAGQFLFGGWAFQVTMDKDPAVTYDNALYIDNCSMSVTPEPATLALLGLGGLVLLRRK